MSAENMLAFCCAKLISSQARSGCLLALPMERFQPPIMLATLGAWPLEVGSGVTPMVVAESGQKGELKSLVQRSVNQLPARQIPILCFGMSVGGTDSAIASMTV